MVSGEARRHLYHRVVYKITEYGKKELMKSFQVIIRAAAVILIGVLTAMTFILGAIGSIAAAQTQDIVYNDEITSEWVTGTWPCYGGIGEPEYNVTQSEVVNNGTHAIEINHSSPSCPGGWGAFTLDRRSGYSTIYYMYPNQYKNLSFYFNPGPTVYNENHLSIIKDDGYSVGLRGYINGELIPNKWYRINIPLADFNNEQRFYRLVFWFNDSDTVQYYLDDISLDWVEDLQPPVITNVTINNISGIGAEITWQTDEYAISGLSYGAGENNLTINETDYTTDHRIQLTDLSPDTTYNFSIVSMDHQVNASQPRNSARYNGGFTTGPPDTIPPVISNVSAIDIKSNSATIIWTTDEPADSRVYYGENNYSSNRTDDSLTTSHLLVIKGLKSKTTYQYRVVSRDASGNLAAYEEIPPKNFTTIAYPRATLRVDAGNDIHPFSRDIRGVNIVPWASYWERPYPNESAKLRELTRLIKPGVLRYGGGIWSNNITWDRNNTQPHPSQWTDTNGDGSGDTMRYRVPYNYPDITYDDNLSVGYDRCKGSDPIQVENAYHYGYQADEIDDLAAFADYVGADVMMEVDITTCDPNLWADMVNYTNREKNYNFKYWELGNELNLENANRVPDMPVGGEYVSRYKKYYKAMKARDNSILIVGPTTAGVDDNSFRALTDFIDPLTLDSEIRQNRMLDLLSYHVYPLWNRQGGEVNYQDMFAYAYDPEGRARENINHFARDKRELLDNRGFPDTRIAVSEFSSITADSLPTAYTSNHANALYMADTLARQAYSGADMVIYWMLGHSGGLQLIDFNHPGGGLTDLNGSNIAFGQGGDFFFEDKYHPLPVYYTYFMYAQLFGDMLVWSSSSMEDRLSVWASTDSSEPNNLKLMVVNLADESVNATLNLSGFNPVSGRYYELTNQEFVAAPDKAGVLVGTSINGLEINSSSADSIIGSAQRIIDSGKPLDNPGDSFNHVFPAYSATIIVLNTTSSEIHSVTNLKNISYARNYINWTWREPTEENFSKVLVYIDSVFRTKVQRGVRFYNLTGISAGTAHKISTRTVDNTGRTNMTWKNHTARAAPAPVKSSIVVVAPNGGGIWQRGTTQKIRWNYTGSPGSYVKIELLKGGALNRVINSSVPIGLNGSGFYNWLINSTQTPGTDYKVRIISKNNSAYNDSSNNNFTISGGITITSPNGRENWTRGTTQKIRWNYTGSPGSYVKIELLKGGKLNRTIKSSISTGSNGSGSYNWLINSTQTPGTDYKVRVTSKNNSAYTDTSNNNFTINS